MLKKILMYLQCNFYVFSILNILCCSAVFALPIDKIINFGDSLSDNGNLYKWTVNAHHVDSSVSIIPKSPPYYQGHFSNGSIWIEDLAQTLHVPLIDYAYGGAWAEDYAESNQVFPFDLSNQVDMYISTGLFDIHKSQHLYVFWIGGNDYLSGRTDEEAATTQTVAAIASGIKKLSAIGAKNFLILNLPDLGDTPSAKAQGVTFSANLTALSRLHNQKLAELVLQLQQSHPAQQFILVDIYSYFLEVIQHSDQYGLKNVSDACYGGSYSLLKLNGSGYNRISLLGSGAPSLNDLDASQQSTMIDLNKNPTLFIANMTAMLASKGVQPCADPNTYLFWDGVHPTMVTHQLIAQKISDIFKVKYA